MTKTYFLDRAAFDKAETARQEFAKSRTDGKQYASLVDVIAPGAMWFATWYFDPEDRIEMADRRTKALERIASGQNLNDYLSRFYWQDWSLKRPPICVLCPNGAEWCVDAKSSNGEGWQVTGDVPVITAAPSIAVTGYHGFLRDGVFTPDLENRGLTGLRQL